MDQENVVNSSGGHLEADTCRAVLFSFTVIVLFDMNITVLCIAAYVDMHTYLYIMY